MFHDEFLQLLRRRGLGELLGISTVSGGSINEAYQLEMAPGNFFLKTNRADLFPNMFEAEANGLELLSKSAFKIPEPLLITESDGEQYLVMEWIEKGSTKPDFWDEFGRCLAGLHTISSKDFGLDRNNYIGSLHQSNTEHGTWADLYREERLIPQMKMAEANGNLTSTMKGGFDTLFRELENIYPIEKPSLIHGDLWSGNMMVAANGTPCIYDPAVYYGHREMDLGMMALFGGFGSEWIDAYNEVYPLESGWQERIPIGQLYPLMVHVNLFGGGYGRSVEAILQRFT